MTALAVGVASIRCHPFGSPFALPRRAYVATPAKKKGANRNKYRKHYSILIDSILKINFGYSHFLTPSGTPTDEDDHLPTDPFDPELEVAKQLARVWMRNSSFDP